MSDPGLSRPPFIPEGTFRCCLCFNVYPIAEAWVDEVGRVWDECQECAKFEKDHGGET